MGWPQTGRGPESGTRPSRGHLRSLRPLWAASPTRSAGAGPAAGTPGISSHHCAWWFGPRPGVSLGSSVPAAPRHPSWCGALRKNLRGGGTIVIHSVGLVPRRGCGRWRSEALLSRQGTPFLLSFSVRGERSLRSTTLPLSLTLPRTGNP